MLHTVLNRGCSIWERDALPESEFRGRLDKIRAGIKERDVDLLLVYGDSWRYGHLAFVSHFIPKNRGALAAIPLAGEPALIVQEPSRNNPFSKTLTWIDEVRSVGQFAQGLGDALKARQLKPRRVGLVSVEEQLNIREWNGLLKLLEGAGLSDLSALLVSLRLVKSAAEQAMVKKCASILERSLELFQRELRPGQKEHEIAAVAEREARRRGVEDFRFMLARSAEPDIGLRPPGPSAIDKGELLLVAVAASYQRTWAEIGRTFSARRPAQELQKVYDLAKGLFRKLKDGVTVGSAPQAAADFLSEVPVAARNSLLAYGLGNGIGLDMSEAPFLGREGSFKIQPGMALTLRVCFSGKDCGSALISQPFLMSENGLQPLVRPVEDLVLIEG
jgi:Xaa-Pro aminopeptidase